MPNVDLRAIEWPKKRVVLGLVPINWGPVDGSLQTLCGEVLSRDVYHQNNMLDRDQDLNTLIRPSPRFWALWEDVLLATAERPADLPAAWKKAAEKKAALPWVESEVESPYPGDKWISYVPRQQEVCVFGVWARDGAHGGKPEIHPQYAVWWQDGTKPDTTYLILTRRDTSSRFKSWDDRVGTPTIMLKASAIGGPLYLRDVGEVPGPPERVDDAGSDPDAAAVLGNFTIRRGPAPDGTPALFLGLIQNRPLFLAISPNELVARPVPFGLEEEKGERYVVEPFRTLVHGERKGVRIKASGLTRGVQELHLEGIEGKGCDRGSCVVPLEAFFSKASAQDSRLSVWVNRRNAGTWEPKVVRVGAVWSDRSLKQDKHPGGCSGPTIRLIPYFDTVSEQGRFADLLQEEWWSCIEMENCEFSRQVGSMRASLDAKAPRPCGAGRSGAVYFETQAVAAKGEFEVRWSVTLPSGRTWTSEATVVGAPGEAPGVATPGAPARLGKAEAKHRDRIQEVGKKDGCRGLFVARKDVMNLAEDQVREGPDQRARTFDRMAVEIRAEIEGRFRDCPPFTGPCRKKEKEYERLLRLEIGALMGRLPKPCGVPGLPE